MIRDHFLGGARRGPWRPAMAVGPFAMVCTVGLSPMPAQNGPGVIRHRSYDLDTLLDINDSFLHLDARKKD